DIRGLTNLLHQKNIYIIGRIAVFQDPYFIKKYPELAVKTKTDKNKIWKDRKGISWIDSGSKEAWDYTIAIAKESYASGFDEINFDYIRFPSDGNMKDMYLPISDGKIKAEVLKSFFIYLNEELKKTEIPMSADLFGMTTTQKDDMNIGQIFENALPYFDFIDPMVYPSHYPNNWNNFKKPAEKPYEVVNIALKSAVDRAVLAGFDKNKVRPWLQDFNLGATYTGEMVRAQIKATYDNGLNSWLLWDPANTYTRSALEIMP
ncbi:MAG: GTP-binding protein, partial [Desulfobacterales bacterium]|nr:GTP-binding protein [Desulfobacterales bacterium]